MLGSPSRGVVTCDSGLQTLTGWGLERVVTTGWSHVVTTQLAQMTAADDWRKRRDSD